MNMHTAGCARWVCLLVLLRAFTTTALEARPYPLVQPVPGRSQLALSEEGLGLLEGLQGPIAPVVVIGPYRSGKSFLLNQLLGVHCDAGFGVGHTRETETKGMWIWGQPQVVDDAGTGGKTLLFVDTEGFESTGRANSYDDRIFAVAAVMSSLLVYNLPETIRASDVAKLSFAVELAAGFYEGTAGASVRPAGGGAEPPSSSASAMPLQPGSMLWLIQRDFLGGKSVQKLVDDALAPVPNPQSDKEIAQLNAVRASLTLLASNSTGYSLRQPHLERTRLCELTDDQLDHTYVQQRDALKQLVHTLARPKAVGSQSFSGRQLADLLRAMVKALNAKEIPTGASLIESFNRDLLSRALDVYSMRLEAVPLPVETAELDKADGEARVAALALFQEQLLGRRQGPELRETLEQHITKALRIHTTANVAESNVLCQAVEMKCERLLDRLTAMALPSMHTFDSSYAQCLSTFTAKCIGPAKAGSLERLQMAQHRAKSDFSKDYNDHLYTGLLVASVLAIVLFRFVLRWRLLEMAAWAGMLFLQVVPRLYGGAAYQSTWWRATAQVWEGVMFLLFAFPLAPLAWVAAIAVAWWLVHRARWRRAGTRAKRKALTERDLDV